MVTKDPKTKPDHFDRWNRAHRGAFMKGYQAFLDGQEEGACPYLDKRKGGNKLTWSRSFGAAWRDGWRWAKKEQVAETQVRAFSRLA